MRKILVTYLPASMLLAFIAMVLLTCGGGGGDGGGGSTATLTGLSISGPPSMAEYSTATYTASANYDDNTIKTVTPTWSVNLAMASISTSGVLSCSGIDNNQTVTITATYPSGGVTETATMDVTVTDVATIPFTAQMLSGNAFFEENLSSGGDYHSTLSILNTDSSFEQYTYMTPPDAADAAMGTWSIDASGNLIVDVTGQGTFTAMLIADSPTEMQVVLDDGTGTFSTVTLEKTVPADNSILPATYVNQFGDTWIFDSNGTGPLPEMEDGHTHGPSTPEF